MEVHAEDLDVNGRKIRIFISLSEESKTYTVLCKAFDHLGSLLWATDVLGQDGKPQSFHSLTNAISRTRILFGIYKGKARESV